MEEENIKEISIRELIGILIKYKILITGIIVGVVAISIIYSFFLAVPIYYARAELEINGINTGVSIFEQKNHSAAITNELVDQSKNPQFKEQVSRVLADRGIQISGEDLSEILSLNIDKDGKTIILSVRYEAKKDVAQIANIAIDVINQYSSDYLKGKLEEQLTYTGERMELAKVNVDKALFQYKQYLAEPESISKLQSKVNLKESLLVQVKANLIAGNIGAGNSKEQLEHDIKNLEGEIEILNVKLLDEYHIDKLHDEDLKSIFRVYTSFKDEYSRLKIAEMYLSSKSNFNTLSYAVEPESASWPNRRLIVIVSLIVSIGIASLAALAIEYFKNGK